MDYRDHHEEHEEKHEECKEEKKYPQMPYPMHPCGMPMPYQKKPNIMGPQPKAASPMMHSCPMMMHNWSCPMMPMMPSWGCPMMPKWNCPVMRESMPFYEDEDEDEDYRSKGWHKKHYYPYPHSPYYKPHYHKHPKYNSSFYPFFPYFPMEYEWDDEEEED